MIIRRIFVLVCALVMIGCDKPVQQIESTERAIIFNQLPRFLGGGVQSSVRAEGLMYVLPWERVIRIYTAEQSLLLGEGASGSLADSVFTRALDGNEVALKLTLTFQVGDDPEILTKLVQQFASSNEEIRNLLTSVARAEVRSKFNTLETAEFSNRQSLEHAVEAAKASTQKRLDPYGIKIRELVLQNFEFARLQPDGTVDRVYQERLNEIQRIAQESERERLRIETVKSAGLERVNQTQAMVNRQIEEAKGVLAQAEARSEGYLQVKRNEASGTLTKGLAEVKGLTEKIQALAGPGGAAIIKLEIARALKDGDSQFVTLGSTGGGNSNMSVERTDNNELLRQMGLMEALSNNVKEKNTKVAVEKNDEEKK